MRWARIRPLWPIRRRLPGSETRTHASCQVCVASFVTTGIAASCPGTRFWYAASRCGDGIEAFANRRSRSRAAAFRVTEGPPSKIGY
jgi:hypothetical protein